jgi:flagellar hook-associated protein 1 FlgK
MRSSFFGLDAAVRGLFTAQRSLLTVNHNINNVNTPGYSRQQVVQTASTPMALFDGTGMIGTGSEITSVQRVRDEYLDYKYWSENVSYGEWEAKRTGFAELEAIFNEPSDSGFTTVMNEFYNSLQELAKDASSPAVRSLIKEKGVTLAKYFNSTSAQLEKMQSDINYRIKTKVLEINSYAEQIAQLNKQIYTYELDGNTANDLRDQRTVLIDKMSRIINVEAYEVTVGKLPNGKDDKHFIITISGKTIVNHFQTSELALVQRDSSQQVNAEDIPDLYQVGWKDGNSLEIKGGELRGYLDLRDGNEGQVGPNGIQSPQFKGIPYYIKKLNEFVRTFAKAFNEGIVGSKNGTGHADGYGLDPDKDGPAEAATGIRFFTRLDSSGNPESSSSFIPSGLTDAEIEAIYNTLTAKNFTVSSDVLSDYNTIAASSNGQEVGNIDNLNAIINMRHDQSMFSEGAPEDFMKSLVSNLGVDSQQAVRYTERQQAIVDQVESRRLSYSGVSLDEEMANLVRYQHAYNAAAKMISTMDEIYNVLVNKLGIG